MHEVLVNRLGGLSLPRKSVVRLTDRPNMTLDVYRGRKTTMPTYSSSVYTSQFVNSFCVLGSFSDSVIPEASVILESSEYFISTVFK